MEHEARAGERRSTTIARSGAAAVAVLAVQLQAAGVPLLGLPRESCSWHGGPAVAVDGGDKAADGMDLHEGCGGLQSRAKTCEQQAR